MTKKKGKGVSVNFVIYLMLAIISLVSTIGQVFFGYDPDLHKVIAPLTFIVSLLLIESNLRTCKK